MKALRVIVAILILVLLGLGIWVVFFHESPDEAEADSEVETKVAVKSAPLVRKTLSRRVEAYGLVQPEPATEDRPAAVAKLSLPTSGLITEVRCWEGKEVEKGELLISLDTRQAESLLNQAKAAAEFAEQEFERQKKLVAIEGTSEKSFQSARNERDKAQLEIASAQSAISLLQVESPLAGVVTTVNASPGETADPTRTLVEIIDPSRLVLSVRVPASEAAQVQTGQTANFLHLGSSLPVGGRVIFVNPRVDPASGSVGVRASLPVENEIQPGEWLEAGIVTEEKADALAAPIESVTMTEDGDSVVAVIEGETARQVPVKTGIQDGGWVEVEGEGLQAGTPVVTEGAYGLPAETKVRILGQ